MRFNLRLQIQILGDRIFPPLLFELYLVLLGLNTETIVNVKSKNHHIHHQQTHGQLGIQQAHIRPPAGFISKKSDISDLV
jgi:hypothetical protein